VTGLGGSGITKSSGFSTYRPLFLIEAIIFPIASENFIGSIPKSRMVGKPGVIVSET
jgi:hypothetical protein